MSEHQRQSLIQINGTLRDQVRPPHWRSPTPRCGYNLVILGGGTAGLVSAAVAAGLGAKVALVERHLLGGDCLNTGCVPSKALIAAARAAHSARRAIQYGVACGEVRTDFDAVMERMTRIRARLARHDSAQRFSGLGVDVFFGQGRFTGARTMDVAGESLRFGRAVIATGSRPKELSVPGIDTAGYLTNETVFGVTRLPRAMVVLGGGPIGCELAQCFARLGTSVTLIERDSHLLIREDPDAAAIVQRAIQRDGVRVIIAGEVSRVEIAGGVKRVIVRHSGEETAVSCDEILVAIGRCPNIADLGLESAGVQADPVVGVAVDRFLRTSNARVYAAGDVCSQFKFTHAADFLARIAVQNALFAGRTRATNLIVPWCTYTSPELAHVGVQPQTANETASAAISTFYQDLSEVDRAVLDGEDEGFIKIHCRKGTDRIIGATIVAARAGDLIGYISLAMANKIGLKAMGRTIHPYPTQSEAIRKLGDQYNRSRLTPLLKSVAGKWMSWKRWT